MAKDVSDAVRGALGSALREAVNSMGDVQPQKKARSFSGAKGLAAGVGLAALAPLAKKGVDAVRNGAGPSGVASKAASKVGDKVKDGVTSKIDQAGGAGGLAKEAAQGVFGGGDDDEGGREGMPGVGDGRRMPIQQAVDVAVPLETAYNQFTQFEDWPEFMHRVQRVTQDDDCSVSFQTKIWGKTKEFKADIETQRPDERIKWRVTQGINHAGVVTFHELAPSLTRIEVSLDVEPDSLIEKAARGMRHIKRAVRADLSRFKAFVEMQEKETGAWRGVIEDGKLVEEHDESYDDEREYSDVQDIYSEPGDSDEDDEDDEDDSQSSRSQRFKRQAESSKKKSGSSSRSRSKGSRSGSSSKSGGNSKSSGSKTKAKSRSSSSSRKSSSSNGRGSGSKRSSGSKSGNGRRKAGSRS